MRPCGMRPGRALRLPPRAEEAASTRREAASSASRVEASEHREAVQPYSRAPGEEAPRPPRRSLRPCPWYHPGPPPPCPQPPMVCPGPPLLLLRPWSRPGPPPLSPQPSTALPLVLGAVPLTGPAGRAAADQQRAPVVPGARQPTGPPCLSRRGGPCYPTSTTGSSAQWLSGWVPGVDAGLHLSRGLIFLPGALVRVRGTSSSWGTCQAKQGAFPFWGTCRARGLFQAKRVVLTLGRARACQTIFRSAA